MASLTITIDFDDSKCDPDEMKDVLEAAIFTYSVDDEHILSAVQAMKFDQDEVKRETDVNAETPAAPEKTDPEAEPDAPPAEDDPALADPADEEATTGAALNVTPAQVVVAADGSIQADVTTSVEVPPVDGADEQATDTQ